LPLRQLWPKFKTDWLGGWLFLLFRLAALSILVDRAFNTYKGGCKTSAFTGVPSAEFWMLRREMPSIEQGRSYGVSIEKMYFP